MSDFITVQIDDDYDWRDDEPLTPEEVAAAARMEKRLQPLADYCRDLRLMREAEPVLFEEVPLRTREFLFGPQRKSFVHVEIRDGVVLDGRVESWDLDEGRLEIDFYGWYGEFQITHSLVEITMGSKPLTSEDEKVPSVWREASRSC
jgi:hypothetical protein